MAGRVAWVSIHREGAKMRLHTLLHQSSRVGRRGAGTSQLPRYLGACVSTGEHSDVRSRALGVRYQCAPHRGARALWNQGNEVCSFGTLELRRQLTKVHRGSRSMTDLEPQGTGLRIQRTAERPTGAFGRFRVHPVHTQSAPGEKSASGCEGIDRDLRNGERSWKQRLGHGELLPASTPLRGFRRSTASPTLRSPGA